MQNLVLTQLSIPEVRQIFRDELAQFFSDNQILSAQPEPDEIGGIELAMKITGKAKPTIYSLCADRKIPHFKKSKQLLFSRNDLLEWIKAGRRKTQTEIAADAAKISN